MVNYKYDGSFVKSCKIEAYELADELKRHHASVVSKNMDDIISVNFQNMMIDWSMMNNY
jgi:hypothetical protein